MTYTDTQLKAALAKMLPGTITVKTFHGEDKPYSYLYWLSGATGTQVLDTELLHLCWMLEKTLSDDNHHLFRVALRGNLAPTRRDKIGYYSPPWQQRVIALAKVKGIEL